MSPSWAEAEFYGVVKAGSGAIGTWNIAEDLALSYHGECHAELLSDPSSAIRVAVKRCVEKIRHLETQKAVYCEQDRRKEEPTRHAHETL